MNKIKFIILLGAIFIFSSCSFTEMPKTWDSFSGRMTLKLMKKSCMTGWKWESDSNVSEEERQIAESYCECYVEELQLTYPNPRDVPTQYDLSTHPDMQGVIEKCFDDILDNSNE